MPLHARRVEASPGRRSEGGSPIELDDRLVRNLIGAHGAAGHAFVRELPATLAYVRDLWGLEIGLPWRASYAFVAPARRLADRRELVLKLSVPGRGARAEAAALRWFDGEGAVRVVECEDDAGALLLERARPGIDLVDVDDGTAVTLVAGVIRRLHGRRVRSPPQTLPTVEDWAAGFRRSGLRRPEVADADGLFRELCASAGPPIVLHGDLHHGNLLAHGRGCVAIDPHGVIGEAPYEIGAFVRNPLPGLATQPEATQRIARRLDLFAAELGFDRARMHAWCYAQAVLAACWDVEDGADPAPSLAVAAAISRPS